MKNIPFHYFVALLAMVSPAAQAKEARSIRGVTVPVAAPVKAPLPSPSAQDKAFEAFLTKRIFIDRMYRILSSFTNFSLPYLGHGDLASEALVLRGELKKLVEAMDAELPSFLQTPVYDQKYAVVDSERMLSKTIPFLEEMWQSYSTLMPQFFTPQTFQQAFREGKFHKDTTDVLFKDFLNTAEWLKYGKDGCSLTAQEAPIFARFFAYCDKADKAITRLLSPSSHTTPLNIFGRSFRDKVDNIMGNLLSALKVSPASMVKDLTTCYDALKKDIEASLVPLSYAKTPQDALDYIRHKAQISLMDKLEKTHAFSPNNRYCPEGEIVKSCLDHAKNLETLKDEEGNHSFKKSARTIRNIMKKYEQKA